MRKLVLTAYPICSSPPSRWPLFDGDRPSCLALAGGVGPGDARKTGADLCADGPTDQSEGLHHMDMFLLAVGMIGITVASLGSSTRW
jgi:hypothetical protein